MKKLIISFHECEHDTDLENYLVDLRNSGADITDTDLDYDEETADVRFTVKDKNEFLIKFIETEAFGFSNYESVIDKANIFDRMKKAQEQSDMDNIPREDYGINPSY